MAQRSEYIAARRYCRCLCAVWPLVVLTAIGLSNPCAAEQSDSSPIDTDSLGHRIDALINQLGADTYRQRREAELALTEIGDDAFDQLKTAEEHLDPEISARAKHLTRRLTVDWTRPGDSSRVRALLQQYGEKELTQRLQVVTALGNTADESAQSALCRIVRFDESPLVAKRASLSIIKPSTDAAVDSDITEKLRKRSTRILAELGRSRRTAANWLRTYAAQLSGEGADVAHAWEEHVRSERARLATRDRAIHRVIVIDLMKHLASLYEQQQQDEQLLALLIEMVELDETGEAGILRQLVNRLIENQNWPVIEDIVQRFEDRFANEPILMYLLAQARLAQGELEKAQQLADQAFELTSHAAARNEVAEELDNRGLFDWAEREYRALLDSMPADSIEAMFAASRFSFMLHDLQRHGSAAKVLDEFLSKRDELVGDDKDDGPFSLAEQVQTLRSRAEYYRAWEAHERGDYTRERKYLETALQHEPRDIDVMIAMFRLPQQPPEFRKRVVRLIENESVALEKQVRSLSRGGTNYNNWAWLIANTQGDFDRAIRYAHKAVDSADSDSRPGFLDTLGRAYYAKGDLENAIKYQKQAVELDPHTQQLKRQLELFEQTAQQEK